MSLAGKDNTRPQASDASDSEGPQGKGLSTQDTSHSLMDIKPMQCLKT